MCSLGRNWFVWLAGVEKVEGLRFLVLTLTFCGVGRNHMYDNEAASAYAHACIPSVLLNPGYLVTEKSGPVSFCFYCF